MRTACKVFSIFGIIGYLLSTIIMFAMQGSIYSLYGKLLYVYIFILAIGFLISACCLVAVSSNGKVALIIFGILNIPFDLLLSIFMFVLCSNLSEAKRLVEVQNTKVNNHQQVIDDLNKKLKENEERIHDLENEIKVLKEEKENKNK